MFIARARLFVVTLSFLVFTLQINAQDPHTPHNRSFEFTYGVQLNGLTPGQQYRLWLPCPPSNEAQSVKLLERRSMQDAKLTRESKYGNQMYYLEGPANAQGEADCTLVFNITRQEVLGKGPPPDAKDIQMFLQADKLVPVGGKALSLIEGKKLPDDRMAAGKTMYDVVNGHMKYSKDGTGWGRGDSDWACDSKFGNCSDFHSLFISLARYQKMPAKFEIGFSLPTERGTGEIAGYHCWAYFLPDEKSHWIPVDISEANKNPTMAAYYFGNLTENRVTLSTGRDIVLEPAQQGAPLNFFVYPYAEVDGKPVAAEKLKRTVKFKDTPMPR